MCLCVRSEYAGLPWTDPKDSFKLQDRGFGRFHCHAEMATWALAQSSMSQQHNGIEGARRLLFPHQKLVHDQKMSQIVRESA